MKLWIKIGLVITAVIALFVVTLLFLSDRKTDEALTSERDHTLNQIAEHIAEEIEQPLRLGQAADIAQRLNEHRERNAELVYLFVTTGAGDVIAQAGSSSLSPDHREGADGHASVPRAVDALRHLSVRISKGMDAELHVGASDIHHQEVVGRLHRAILGAGALFVLLGAVLSFFAGYIMTRPLREVIAGLETVGQGDLDHRLAVSGSGESGMLARAFNEMADRRREAEDTIVQMTFELDERVQERTAQLEAANREMEAFSYSVSHDLRAPLRSLDGFSKALLDDYADKLDADGRDYLRRVRKASQRMGQLIDDILKLSRLTRGEILIEQLDMSALVREVVKPLTDGNPDRKVKVHIQDGVVVRGDRKMLRVVLENLIGNAWKYTSKQPLAWITFGMAPSRNGNAYFVKDNGAGFDMAFSQKLFAPFQRLHSDKEFPGTGIGLATVQRIIHRHGGEIWAESEPGKGATFYFTLGRGNA